MLVSFEGRQGQGMTLSREHFELLDKLEKDELISSSKELETMEEKC